MNKIFNIYQKEDVECIDHHRNYDLSRIINYKAKIDKKSRYNYDIDNPIHIHLENKKKSDYEKF